MASAAASRPGARVHVELSQRLRRTTKQPFAADALRFTGTKQLWNDSTAPWPERLFEHQYAVEMNTNSDMSKLGYRSTAWVKRLPAVVSALNNEVTRLTGKKPAQAIKEKTVSSKPATPYMRPVGVHEKKLPPQAHVRYLYYPGELEWGGRRAIDPIWSLKVYNVYKVVTKPDAPVVYYLYDGPKRGFVREELMVVPPGTQLPPAGV